MCIYLYLYVFTNFKLKGLRKKLANMNLKKDLSILRNGVLLLTALFKQCNGGRLGWIFAHFLLIFYFYFTLLFLL